MPDRFGGESLIIPITVESLTAHNLPSGTAFNREAWIEIIVSQNSNIIYSSGLISSILIPYFINKSLGGHNGDSYGASLVISETTNLLILSIILVPN